MFQQFIKKQNNTLIISIWCLIVFFLSLSVKAQDTQLYSEQKQAIYQLIDQYNQAREKKDINELKRILTPEIDQLVSSGEWRRGRENSVEGMLQSSNRNQGTRRITIESVRFLDSDMAIVDTRYEIALQNNTRNLWSTFIVIRENNQWKITAIRNMSPTGNP